MGTGSPASKELSEVVRPTWTATASPAEQTTPTALASTETQVAKPTVRMTPTPSQVIPPPTPTVTQTPVKPLPKMELVKQCLTVKDTLPPGMELAGKLIRLCESGACALDLQKVGSPDIPITPTKPNILASAPRISPGGRWLAYEDVVFDQNQEVQSRHLRVVEANGKEQVVLGWDPRWELYQWHDDERLEVKLVKGDSNSIFLYNPFTGERSAEIQLPPLERPYLGDSLITGPNENYDPTFSRVVYRTWDYTFTLWDVQEHKLLWERNTGAEGLYTPSWSPNGKRFAVAAEVDNIKPELFVVDWDGQETQLTDLIHAFPGMHITIGYFDWSPDGRYIALWLNIRPGEDYEQWSLAVLDVQTGKLTDYCIPSSRSQFPYALWSPDSQKIAVQTYAGTDIGEHYLTVVDIVREIAVRLPVGGFLVGWMVSP